MNLLADVGAFGEEILRVADDFVDLTLLAQLTFSFGGGQTVRLADIFLRKRAGGSRMTSQNAAGDTAEPRPW